MLKMYILFYILFVNIALNKCNIQIGPEPWDYVNNVNSDVIDEDIPPDLKDKPQRKLQTTNNIGIGEWFYKRILTIVLKGGQMKKNEDGSIDISLHMKYNEERWNILDGYIKPNTAYSEDMYRRSIGYIEEAIIKPSISEKIVLAWSEYFQLYLTEYKTYIMWAASISAGILTVLWMWNHISHKHVIILIIIGLYLYEVLISYKEAEKQELDRFITAVNTCKWYIWTTECHVPPPDPLIFLKHMNPLKIGIRMFTTLISEPMITISETIKVIIHGITDGLWFPLNKIMYGILVVTFMILLVFLLIMIIFNYILNIPFKLSFLGILSIGLSQRNRSMQNTIVTEPIGAPQRDNTDRISGENLSKLLEVYTRALNSVNSSQIQQRGTPRNTNPSLTYKSKLTRSASTGRLPNYESECHNNNHILQPYKHNGSGDAH
ncbi:uncharacterized protein LOC124530323 [Vanessa cardui]|uniref:uncharacterized protein LOC124530323 n=1 Tax=Vanessa cardui TaxID=171605 RepID=UPI001F13A482|nr:uncharacterized protein LOC124530323 [Vanessa cardui]